MSSSSAAPIRLRHAALPLIAMLADRGLDLTLGIKAGYNPETAVASWRVEIFSRYAATRETWVGTDVVSVAGQTVTLAAAPDAVSAEDAELALSDVIGGRGACFLTLMALPAEGAPLWQCQGPVDFVAAGSELAPGSVIGRAITMDLGAGTTIELSIVNVPGQDGGDGAPGASAYEIAVENGFEGTEAEWLLSLRGEDGEPGAPGSDANVTNANVNAAIAADPAATRTAAGLGTAALEDAGAFQAADPTLTALAALVTAANKLIYATGSDEFAVADFTAAARTFVAASTTAAQRAALGLGSADSVEFGLCRVDPTGAGGSFSVPVLKVGQYQTGIAHAGDFFMALIVNGTRVAGFDPRGGTNASIEAGWPYITAGMFRPVSMTVATAGDTTQYNGCIGRFADGNSGAPCLAFCTGGQWLRITVGPPVSAA